MKLSTVLLAVGASSVSGSLVLRDLATIQGVLSQVSQQVDKLSTAVKSFSGDPGPLSSANDQLISILKDGTSKVSGTSALTQNEALSVTSSVQQLNTSVADAVDALIAKKSDFVSANAGGIILQDLQAQKSGSDALAAAITSKVPTALQGVAAQLSGDIGKSLDRGIAAFQGTGGSPPSGTGSAAPPSGSAKPTTSAGGIGGSSPSSGGGAVTPSYTAAGSAPTQFTGAGAINAPQLAALGIAIVGLVM